MSTKQEKKFIKVLPSLKNWCVRLYLDVQRELNRTRLVKVGRETFGRYWKDRCVQTAMNN